LALFLVSLSCLHAQDSIPPYKRFPTLPPIQILLSDSTTMFTKAEIPEKKQVLFILFDPDCSHCQHETEEIIAHRDEMKNIEIVMVTMQTLTKMKDFISNYKLNELSNVVVGKDIYFFMPSFYMIHNLPFLALYNRKGELINAYEGSIPIPKIIEVFKQNQ